MTTIYEDDAQKYANDPRVTTTSPGRYTVTPERGSCPYTVMSSTDLGWLFRSPTGASVGGYLDADEAIAAALTCASVAAHKVAA